MTEMQPQPTSLDRGSKLQVEKIRSLVSGARDLIGGHSGSSTTNPTPDTSQEVVLFALESTDVHQPIAVIEVSELSPSRFKIARIFADGQISYAEQNGSPNPMALPVPGVIRGQKAVETLKWVEEVLRISPNPV